MAGKQLFSEQLILENIVYTGGVIVDIAKNVGCDRQTIYRAITKWPSISVAIETEKEHFLGDAESVVLHNIKVSRKQLLKNPNKPVDSTDAKFLLAKRSHDYTDKLDVRSVSVVLDVPEDKINGFADRFREIATILANNE